MSSSISPSNEQKFVETKLQKLCRQLLMTNMTEYLHRNYQRKSDSLTLEITHSFSMECQLKYHYVLRMFQPIQIFQDQKQLECLINKGPFFSVFLKDICIQDKILHYQELIEYVRNMLQGVLFHKLGYILKFKVDSFTKKRKIVPYCR